MTPKKECLIKYGVLKEDNKSVAPASFLWLFFCLIDAVSVSLCLSVFLSLCLCLCLCLTHPHKPAQYCRTNLLGRDNVDRGRLDEFVRAVVNYFELPQSCQTLPGVRESKEEKRQRRDRDRTGRQAQRRHRQRARETNITFTFPLFDRRCSNLRLFIAQSLQNHVSCCFFFACFYSVWSFFCLVICVFCC